MLSELALRQEEYRELVGSIKEQPDKAYSETLAVESFDEEELIAVSTVLFELKHRDPDEVNPATIEDVMWAGEFIDHLDTLGWKLVRK